MIPVKNIYYMLAYAFKCLKEAGYKNIELEEFENVAELCSAILCRGISSQLKQGLNKKYELKTEDISLLKGKINFADSIKQNILHKRKVVCTYDEFTVNSYMNQIIKTTILFLLKADVSPQRKKDLKKIIIYFSEVDTLDIDLIDWNIRYSKNNQTYRMLISICYLVLVGLLQTQADGSKKMMDFLDEQRTSRLYEKFLLEFYKVERPDLHANSPQISWAVEEDDSLLPVMQTDLALHSNNKLLIIDAKYYSHSIQQQYETSTLISGNLYQIFTYVKNQNAKNESSEVAGMLLYAKTDDNIVPDNNVYKMSGNTIVVHSLDLNRDFLEIKKELNKIADIYCC